MNKNKKGGVLIIIFLLSLSTLAQQKFDIEYQILQKEIEEHPSYAIKDRTFQLEEKIDRLISLSDSDFEKGKLFKQKGILLKKINRSWYNDLFNLAIESFEKSGSPKEVFDMYLFRYNYLIKEKRYTRAVEQLMLADQVVSKLNNPNLQASVYNSFSDAFYRLEDYNTSIEYLKKSTKIYEKLKNKEKLSQVYNNLAVLHKIKGQLESAVVYNLQSLKLNEELDDQESIVKSYNNLGTNYENIYRETKKGKDLEKAFNYYQKAVNLNSKIEGTNNTALRNLARLNVKRENLKLASDYYLDVITTEKEKQEDNIQLQKDYLELLKIALKSEDLKSAGIYLAELGVITRKIELDHKDEANEMIQNQFELFKKKAELELSEKEKEIQNQKYTQQLLEESLAKEQNLKKAIQLEKEQDSIHQLLILQKERERKAILEKQLNLTQKEKELALVKKEKEVEILQKEQKLNQVKTANTRAQIILGVLLTLFLFILLYFYQYFKNIKLKSEREKILMEQKILRSQMNPHFIFNVLSAIQNTVMENNPLKSASHLSRFSKLIRQNFDFTNREKITLEEDLDVLKNYIKAQQLRFQNKFDYEISIDDALDVSQIKIPPMLLQPFIENAIEHGLKPKKEKGFLQIMIKDEKDKILFRIIDNGVGYKEKKRTKEEHAIDIFKKRLQLLGNKDELSFRIEKLEQGTEVKFSLKV